jgi:hypothetical protein
VIWTHLAVAALVLLGCYRSVRKRRFTCNLFCNVGVDMEGDYSPEQVALADAWLEQHRATEHPPLFRKETP